MTHPLDLAVYLSPCTWAHLRMSVCLSQTYIALQGHSQPEKAQATRKSSCVNARGIPTAAYQVLHLLPEVGYPPAGVPRLARSDGGGGKGSGYLSNPLTSGTPLAKSDGGYPRWGTPCWGTPSQVWLGGYPRWSTPPPPHWIWLGTPCPQSGPGRSTPPRCEQTKNITFPRTTYAVGKNSLWCLSFFNLI